MLINQQDGNIFSVVRVIIESLLDQGGFGLGVNDKEILLRVGGLCNMLRSLSMPRLDSQ